MTGFQVFRYTLIVLGTVALAALFVATLDVWIVLWLAILIASALRPSIMRLKDWGISQNVAIPIVYGGVLTISLVLLLLVVPPVVNQLVRYLQNDNLLVIRILSTQRWVEGVLGSITGSPVTLGSGVARGRSASCRHTRLSSGVSRRSGCRRVKNIG